jgi:hypothetical protein
VVKEYRRSLNEHTSRILYVTPGGCNPLLGQRMHEYMLCFKTMDYHQFGGTCRVKSEVGSVVRVGGLGFQQCNTYK